MLKLQNAADTFMRAGAAISEVVADPKLNRAFDPCG